VTLQTRLLSSCSDL